MPFVPRAARATRSPAEALDEVMPASLNEARRAGQTRGKGPSEL
jgi:hypothetical protein